MQNTPDLVLKSKSKTASKAETGLSVPQQLVDLSRSLSEGQLTSAKGNLLAHPIDDTRVSTAHISQDLEQVSLVSLKVVNSFLDSVVSTVRSHHLQTGDPCLNTLDRPPDRPIGVHTFLALTNAQLSPSHSRSERSRHTKRHVSLPTKQKQ